MALYEIKHRFTEAVLFSLECRSLRICVEAAVKADANLTDVNLRGANLRGANLRGADLEGVNLRGADLRDVNLRGANLADVNLTGADLADANLTDADLAGVIVRGADLMGADLVDAGQDQRGFRFWAWCNDGEIVYRAGCHEWRDISEARDWYGDGYKSTGDRHECLARIELLHAEALRRWPARAALAAAEGQS